MHIRCAKLVLLADHRQITFWTSGLLPSQSYPKAHCALILQGRELSLKGARVVTPTELLRLLTQSTAHATRARAGVALSFAVITARLSKQSSAACMIRCPSSSKSKPNQAHSADGGTRTPTSRSSLAPQASAYTNSATTAGCP